VLGSPLGGATAPKQPAQRKEPELQLTRIDFLERMFSVFLNDGKTRRTTFLGKVYVVHLPADRLDAKVDKAKLPKGGMVLQCDQLITLQHQLPNGKSAQAMDAKSNVCCWTNDLYGRADTLTFDESTDTVTFRGRPGNEAEVYQQVEGPGSGW